MAMDREAAEAEIKGLMLAVWRGDAAAMSVSGRERAVSIVTVLV